MGLFSKKKPTAVSSAPAVLKTTDIKNISSPTASAITDADGFFKSHESRNIKGPKSIKQSTVDERVAKMEEELANRPEAPDYKSYDKNPVRAKELDKANGEFEGVCAEITEKESRTKYNIIRDAFAENVDEKVEQLAYTYDYLTSESYDPNTAEFNPVKDDDEFRRQMEIDMQFAERREKAKSNMPSLTQQQLDMIKEFEQSDISAKPIDMSGKIPELSSEVVDELTAKFEEKYSRISKEKEETESSGEELSQEDKDELERLRAIFG